MTTQILDGTGTLRSVSNLDDFMATNPVGAQAYTAARTVAPAITSDSTKHTIKSAATTNITLVSAAARVMRTLHIYNQTTYIIFFKLYDKATAPVLATDLPFWTIPVAPTSGFSTAPTWGYPVANGLGYAITRAFAPTDTTAVAVEDAVGMLTWR